METYASPILTSSIKVHKKQDTYVTPTQQWLSCRLHKHKFAVACMWLKSKYINREVDGEPTCWKMWSSQWGMELGDRIKRRMNEAEAGIKGGKEGEWKARYQEEEMEWMKERECSEWARDGVDERHREREDKGGGVSWTTWNHSVPKLLQRWHRAETQIERRKKPDRL